MTWLLTTNRPWYLCRGHQFWHLIVCTKEKKRDDAQVFVSCGASGGAGWLICCCHVCHVLPWDEVDALYEAGEFDQALHLLNAPEYSTHFAALYNRAMLHFRKYQQRKDPFHLMSAEVNLGMCVKRDPLFIPALVLQSRVHYLQRRYRASYDTLLSILTWFSSRCRSIEDVLYFESIDKNEVSAPNTVVNKHSRICSKQAS